MRHAITMPMFQRTTLRRWLVMTLLGFLAVSSQIALEDRIYTPKPAVPTTVAWVQSPHVVRHLSLGYNALWADVYWIRAVQYFGGTKLSTEQRKSYDLLYPLLDITTTLDPRFNIAYRLGAILLSEGYPSGAGRTDQAIALLEKGMRAMPDRWQYLHDAGFVYYWWRQDSATAAKWFLKAAEIPGAPNWLRPVAAAMLNQGGERGPARALWEDMLNNAEHEWLREAARRGLMQIDAEEHLELLRPVITRFHDQVGRFPKAWKEVVDAGLLRQAPVDPTGYMYELTPDTGAIDVGRGSYLYPLRARVPGT
jgi:hypothetical protein